MGQAVRKSNIFLDRESIMIEFAPLIKLSVEHIQEHSKIPLDREDLVAAALTGLFEAMKGYDPMVDRNFRSFAELNIRRALLAEIKPAADFFQHVQLQPVGPAEATRHAPHLTYGFDWKGHKYNMH